MNNSTKDPTLGSTPVGGAPAPYTRLTILSVSFLAAIAVAGGVAAMVQRGLIAADSGDSARSSSIFISLAATTVLVVSLVASLLLFVGRRRKELTRRFASLTAAYPDSLCFLVGFVDIRSPAQSSPLSAVRTKDVDALVLRNSEVSLLTIRSNIDVLATVHDDDIFVSVGTREFYRNNVVEILFEFRSDATAARLGVFPAHTRKFSHPSFSDLDALAEFSRQTLRERA